MQALARCSHPQLLHWLSHACSPSTRLIICSSCALGLVLAALGRLQQLADETWALPKGAEGAEEEEGVQEESKRLFPMLLIACGGTRVSQGICTRMIWEQCACAAVAFWRSMMGLALLIFYHWSYRCLLGF